MKHNIANTTSGYLNISEKKEMFKEISEYFNGKFTIKNTSGNVLTTLEIIIPFDKWNIVITESDTKPLKLQVNFESLSDYLLNISSEDVIDKIMKKFGMKELQVGDKLFDDLYLIKTNNPSITLDLLNGSIRNEILKHKLYSISFQTNEKDKNSELSTVVSRTIENKDIYIDLINLHQSLINRLSELKIINN